MVRDPSLADGIVLLHRDILPSTSSSSRRPGVPWQEGKLVLIDMLSTSLSLM